ncbi:hypothetical protein [Serratia odorifera]|uniref:hypothetical protein n=1 Tax=Serratia odorifera TaxID=618 RepID=UPI0013E337B6|nr:hypothetical protein [Serratia odorifera]
MAWQKWSGIRRSYLGNNSYLLWHGGVNGPEREVTVSGNISKDDFFYASGT